jgi:hypothetical protein
LSFVFSEQNGEATINKVPSQEKAATPASGAATDF